MTCYFIKNSGKDVSKAVATVADALDLDLGDEELQKRMAKRLQPFADQILPNRTLEVTVDGKDTLKLGPSNQSGYSSDVRDLSFSYVDNVVVHFSPILTLPDPPEIKSKQ